MHRRPRFLSPQERLKSPIPVHLPHRTNFQLQIGIYVYDHSSVIGRGQYSIVYKGFEQNKPSNIVAIKVITIQQNNPIQQYMIDNEINFLKQIDSSFVLKLLYVERTSKSVYLITPFCYKGDLLQKIQRSLVPEDEAIQYTLQVAKALQAIHAQKIMHGDVKSANILLGEHCVLADFGFAQHIENAQQAFIIGTPLYMAPEILFDNNINCQADMWSLGCVLYEMVYGYSPFYSENNDILKTKLTNFKETGKINFPNTGVTRKIQALIQYLIKLEPKDRLTASDAVELLEPRNIDEQIKINEEQIKIKNELVHQQNKQEIQRNDTPQSPEEHRRSTKNSKQQIKQVKSPMTQTTQQSDSKQQQQQQQQQQSSNNQSNGKAISLIDLVNYFYKVYQLILSIKEYKLAFIYLKLVNIYYMAYLEDQSKNQRKVVFFACQNDYFELEREIKTKYSSWLKEEEFLKIFHSKFILTNDFMKYSLNYLNQAIRDQEERISEKIKKTVQILSVLNSNEKSSTLQLDQQIIRLHRLNSKV